MCRKKVINLIFYLGVYLKKYTLHSLLSRYFNNIKLPNDYISDIKINSKYVLPGDLFIAIKGFLSNGKKFVSEAVCNGAIAILLYSDSYSYFLYNKTYNVYFFHLLNLNFYLSDISNIFYNKPSKKMCLVGVTGTNGKTTVVSFLSQWLFLLNYKTSILSTIGNGLYNRTISTVNTTDSAVEIQSCLKKFLDSNVEFVSLEVSSHSLIQYRVKSVFFSAAIFTNLSIDHLDFHINMFNYELAKWKLFSEFNINNLIINIDDNIGLKWFNILSKDIVIPVTFNKKYICLFKNRWLCLDKIVNYGFFKKIYFFSYWGNGVLKISFIGFFNIKNFLLSFVTLLSLGFNFNDLLNNSKYLVLPIGRMELFYSLNKPLVIVDYAHTPEALKFALIESRKYCKNRLWCIFGCTGDRDRSKRPIMAEIAEDLSDYVIVTSDNTYYEEEYSIINDIKLGFKNINSIFFILNRNIAINFCIENAFCDDVILLAGKGHEDYQYIMNKKFSFSDRNLISKLFGIEND